MFGTFAGLPLHPLVLHLVVVLGPLTALAAAAYAIRPVWRVWLRGPLVALTLLTTVAAFVSKESGEALARRLGVDVEGDADVTRPAVKAILDHAEAGDRAFISCLLFTIVVLAMVFWAIPASGPDNVGPGVQAACRILTLFLSLAVVIAIFSAGHSGAVSVWNAG